MKKLLDFVLFAIVAAIYLTLILGRSHGGELPQVTLKLPQVMLPASTLGACRCIEGGSCTCTLDSGCKCGDNCTCPRCPGKVASGEPGHWAQFVGSNDYAWWTETGKYCGRWYAATGQYVKVDGTTEALGVKQAEPVQTQSVAYYQAPAFLSGCQGGNCRGR